MGNKVALFDILNKRYQSHWFAQTNKHYVDLLLIDLRIRKVINANEAKKMWGLSVAHISRVDDTVKIDLTALKAGVVMGKQSANLVGMKAEIQKIVPDKKVVISVQSVDKPEVDAASIAFRVEQDMLQRKPCLFSMKRSIADALSFGVKGVRIECGGRIGGAEIAKRVVQFKGAVPRHGIRASKYIQYAYRNIVTASGCCGVKVWVNKGADKLVSNRSPRPNFKTKDRSRFKERGERKK